jgi:regulator of sigma E protease
MIIIWKIVSFFIVLGILVLVHEFGHFITAKLSGVRVEEFSFGFGKRLFGKKIGDTDYKVSLFPLGGYVKMAGEEANDVKGAPDEFESQPKWKKALILLNGPMFNLILTIILLSILFSIGIDRAKYLDNPAKIGWVQKQSPAEQAGIKTGDIVLSINNKKIKNWEQFETIVTTSPREVLNLKVKREDKIIDIKLHPKAVGAYQIGDVGVMYEIPAKIGQMASGMPAARANLKTGDEVIEIDGVKIKNYYQMRNIIMKSPDKELNFKIKRGNKILSVKIKPENQGGRGIIGVVAYFETVKKRYPIFQAIGNSVKETIRLTVLTYQVLKKLIVGKISYKSLSGPIDIADFSYAAVKSGSSGFLQFLAFISLQLGIINLLPIPALDGGHLFVLLIETVVRKDFTPKWKERIAMIGFYTLILLSVFVIINDILKRVH